MHTLIERKQVQKMWNRQNGCLIYSPPCCLNIILLGKIKLNVKCILGDKGVGLTTLSAVYSGNYYSSDYLPTVIDDFKCSLSLGKSEHIMKLTVMDTAGKEHFRDIFTGKYKNCDPKRTIIFLCYSADNEESLENIDYIWNTEVNSISNDFTKVLVRLKEKKTGQVTVRDGDEVGRRLKLAAHLKCDALRHNETKGKKGNVVEVFNNAIQLYFKKPISYNNSEFPCECKLLNLKAKPKEEEKKKEQNSKRKQFLN